MAVNDDLNALAHAVDAVRRSVTTLRATVGATVDVQRLEDDAVRLEADLSLLRRGLHVSQSSSAPPGEIVYVPDEDYDPSLWADAEDEGLGSHGRQ